MVIRLIRNRDFQKLWTAESISVFGSQISLLAIPLTAAIILNVEPFAFAMLGTIEFLPFILFTLPAGAWVDRLPRRPILIIGDLGRAISCRHPFSLLLPQPHHPPADRHRWLRRRTLTVFFDVANQAICRRSWSARLVEGNAKLQVSQSAAEIAGRGCRLSLSIVQTGLRDSARRAVVRRLGVLHLPDPATGASSRP
jgi:hypothetical protein